MCHTAIAQITFNPDNKNTNNRNILLDGRILHRIHMNFNISKYGVVDGGWVVVDGGGW